VYKIIIFSKKGYITTNYISIFLKNHLIQILTVYYFTKFYEINLYYYIKEYFFIYWFIN